MAAGTFIAALSLDAVRLEMETNYFGTLSLCRAVALMLAASSGGVVVSMVSAPRPPVAIQQASAA